ncbi:MAG: hypothetical protein K8R53_14940, partial [Bacteroidales bacterium]|nr:hypothetical protein [Bacteroidales bacterium]
PTIQEYLYNYLSENFEICAETPDPVWIHEFIHMLDFASLIDHINTYRKKQSVKTKFTQEQFLPGIFDCAYRNSSEHWQLLQLFADLRNEGIAQLYEKLLDVKNERMKNLHKVISIFRFFFQSQFGLFNNPIISSRTLHNQYSLRKQFKSTTYETGHWFILRALNNSEDNEVAGLASEALKSLTEKTTCLPKTKVIRIIHEALKMDLAGCLYFHTKFKRSSDFPNFIQMDELLSVAASVTNNFYNNDYKADFLGKLLDLATNKDRNGFISLLDEIIGYAMNETDLEVEYSCFIQKFEVGKNFIEDTICQKINKIWQQWQYSKDPLVGNLLTYIFDSEDLIDDEVPYFGLLDDLYILDASEIILSST